MRFRFHALASVRHTEQRGSLHGTFSVAGFGHNLARHPPSGRDVAVFAQAASEPDDARFHFEPVAASQQRATSSSMATTAEMKGQSMSLDPVALHAIRDPVSTVAVNGDHSLDPSRNRSAADPPYMP